MSHDPFTYNALRPTTSNATSLPSSHLRGQGSHSSLRSGNVNAHSRATRVPARDPFTSSQHAPSRNHRRMDDEVLADSDSDRGTVIPPPANTRLRRVRRLSPDSRQSSKLKQKQEEEVEMVIRQPDGSFIREIPGQAEALKSHLMAQEFQEELAVKVVDDEYVAITRQYFTSGASLESSRGRKMDEEYDELAVSALSSLRAQVLQKLEDEQWRFESTNT